MGAETALEVRFPRGVSSRSARKLLNQKAWLVVSRIFASWNQLNRWLREVDGLRRVA